MEELPANILYEKYVNGMPLYEKLRRELLQSAVGYVWSQKKHLTAFLQNPKIPISNNRAENAIRSFVIGRKNFFVGLLNSNL